MEASVKWSESESEVTQSCLTLCEPMDYSPPGKSTGVGCHFLLRGSSWPRDRTQVSHIAGRRFILWATREAQRSVKEICIFFQVWELVPVSGLFQAPSWRSCITAIRTAVHLAFPLDVGYYWSTKACLFHFWTCKYFVAQPRVKHWGYLTTFHS